MTGAAARAQARIAGFVGVAMLASGSYAGVIGSRLIVPGDAAATARNLAASETLVRLGILCSLVMMLAFLLYALLLGRLLRSVNRGQARIMLGLVVAAVPLYMLNQANQYAAFLVARDGLHDQARLFLDLHRFGNLVAAIFFGLWLFPLGLLVLRSGFLPRVLGMLLMAGSPGYLALFIQGFFFPGAAPSLWGNPLLVLTHLSELALLLWLLVRGVDPVRWDEAHRPPRNA